MNLADKKEEALEAAIDSLARYKFMMFGYWAAIWVHMNQLSDPPEANPFKSLVEAARNIGYSANSEERVNGQTN